MTFIRSLIRSRPRLFLSIFLGAALSLVLPLPLGTVSRALLGWNLSVWIYLVLIGWLMARSGHERVRTIAEQQDRGAVAILLIMTAAALASLLAIVVELTQMRELPYNERLLRYALTGATVLGSWCLLATLFTLHYARAYYRAPSGRGGLQFPDGEPNPDYWDFLYFSYTIAVAGQTSDVSVQSRNMRRIVLAQSVISFFFNVAIIGLSINIAAGLVGS